ncbi:MAG: TatD family hydrolase [Patescibacteria group bacterium]
MKIHDTHAHMDYLLKELPHYKIETTLEEYLFWIQPGVNLVRDRYCLENFMKFPNVFFLVGAHPGEVTEQFDLEEYLIGQQVLLRDFENQIHNRIIGIGEIGLDYRSDTTKEIKEEQKLLFNIQIKLAKELDLPFVVHCRDAFDDLFEVIESNLPLKNPFLIHCFTGNTAQMKKIESLGGFVAYGGIITYNKTEELNNSLKETNNFVIETDLPWLAPTPHRGKTNQPEFINNIITHISKVKSITEEEVLTISVNNSQKIFKDLKIDKL